MKFTPEVIAALQTLKDAAESDFEKHRISVLEKDLTEPPVIEVIDDTHQKFDGVTFKKIVTGIIRQLFIFTALFLLIITAKFHQKLQFTTTMKIRLITMFLI